MNEDIELTIEILLEALHTLHLLNARLEQSLQKENPAVRVEIPDPPPWITISEYLDDQEINFMFDKSKRTKLGLKARKRMEDLGLKPIKKGKSNRYPVNVISEAIER